MGLWNILPHENVKKNQVDKEKAPVFFKKKKNLNHKIVKPQKKISDKNDFAALHPSNFKLHQQTSVACSALLVQVGLWVPCSRATVAKRRRVFFIQLSPPKCLLHWLQLPHWGAERRNLCIKRMKKTNKKKTNEKILLCMFPEFRCLWKRLICINQFPTCSAKN